MPISRSSALDRENLLRCEKQSDVVSLMRCARRTKGLPRTHAPNYRPLVVYQGRTPQTEEKGMKGGRGGVEGGKIRALSE